MCTTHAMDLLLQELPPDVCMAHCLPGFLTTSYPFQSYVTRYAKCTFTAPAAKSPSMGKLSSEGGGTPIINDGWITNLKTKDNYTTCETPIDHAVAEANSLYECNKIYQLININHATLNYLVVSTQIKAINKGYLKGFAGLTSRCVCQHIKVNDEMGKGHMDQSWQGKQLTKASTPAGNLPAFPPNFGPIDTIEPLPQEPYNARTQIIFMTIFEIPGMLFSNQLGWFPIMSNRGNKYVVIFYIYNANFVKSVPIKSRTKEGRVLVSVQVSECLPHSMWIQTATPQDGQQDIL